MKLMPSLAQTDDGLPEPFESTITLFFIGRAWSLYDHDLVIVHREAHASRRTGP